MKNSLTNLRTYGITVGKHNGINGIELQKHDTENYDDSPFSSMVKTLTQPTPEVKNVKPFEIEDILKWFGKAVPNPTDKNRAVQIGCNLEETSELIESVGGAYSGGLFSEMTWVSETYKKHGTIANTQPDRKELLDAICDQIVTAIGIAHMFDLDVVTGLQRVNESNWSKFVDGEPLFNQNGKIAKGPGYKEPNLDGLY